jgi:hypothetical protein
VENPTPAALAHTQPPTVAVSTTPTETPRRDTIRSFAFFPYRGDEQLTDGYELGRRAWADALTSLANLAEPEDWTGAVATDRPLPILDSYLRYTYQRLVMEQKIEASADGEFAAINTGLLTSHAEDVFGLFQRNTRENAQRWVFKKWATESDREILRNFPVPPPMAEYVKSASDLVYDWRRDLKLAYEHILVDNLDRFPAELATQPMRARQSLDHAVAWTLKRARRNYKVVVPQWYPRLTEAGAQFLMPLDLTGTGTADLALVVSAVGDAAYRGHTVLTLEMAYTNARLVARPDSEWLKPQAVPTYEDEAEEESHPTP